MDAGSESKSVGNDLDSGKQSNGGAQCKSVEYNSDHNGDDAKLWLRDDNNSGLLNCSNTQQTTGDTNSEEGPSSAPATRDKLSPNPGSTKGKGLKKWRRIRRNDHVASTVKNTEPKMESQKEKEKDYDSDSTGRMLKRGSDNLNLNLTTSIEKEDEEKEGGSMIPTIISTSTTKANNNNNTSSAFAQDNIATTFSAGVDSEDSHSHRSSSKSSTAASAPKSILRPSAPFHTRPRDKHILKNSNHRLPLSKSPSPSPSDPSKKPRGVDLDVDRDNSPLSSLESDSRSSNPVFIPTKSPLPFDGHSPSLPPHSATATNHHPLPDIVDSIFMLQSAQLALEAEVQKFAEIGKGISSLCDDLDKTSGVPISSLSDPVGYMDHASNGLSEFNNDYCDNIVRRLERQLNEAEDRLKGKDSRIAELETNRRFFESPQDHEGMQQYIKIQEMEAELQDLFKQKVEAEVQSVVLTTSTKVSSMLVEERLNLMRSQTSESMEQPPSPGLAVDVKNKAVIRQEQAEKWDTHNACTIDSKEFLKMKRGVMKFTKYFFIQLALLIFVSAPFVLQLGPKSAVVVPT